MRPITLHPKQSEVFNALFVEKSCRFATVVASRGWGKSHFAAVAAIKAIWELLELRRSVPNKNVAIIAPTYDQVKDIYYPLLAHQFGLDRYAIKSSRDQGRFLFDNEVELRLVSYEAVERLRGKGFYFIINDEVSSWTGGTGLRDAWESIIQPCIATRWSPSRAAKVGAVSPGRALTISTPLGYNYLYDMFHFAESDSAWKSFHYTYNDSPLLDVKEIERIRHTIDPLKFAREYLASFEESGNTVFYCFDRKLHVDKDIPELEADEDVHFCIDFNVGIQATGIFAHRGGQFHFLDESQGHPDTESLAIALATKYAGHRMYAYPDPSGKARKSSAPVGRTDFAILESHGIRVLAKPKAPPISDSVNAVNRMLKTAAGEISIFIHPRCNGIIKSLERTSWLDNNPNTATIDKSQGVEHFSDGIRYAADFLYPVGVGKKSTARGFGF